MKDGREREKKKKKEKTNLSRQGAATFEWDHV